MAVVGGMGLLHPPPLHTWNRSSFGSKVAVCSSVYPLSRRMTVCIFHKLDGVKFSKLFALQFANCFVM